MTSRVTVTHLSPDIKSLICNGCGSEGSRPWFAEKFKDLCFVHDLEFAQGGFIWAWMWSNMKLSLRILKHCFNHDPIWQMPFWMLIALLYFMVLSATLTYTFSYSWPFTKHSLDTIIRRAKQRKAGINPRASINEWVQYFTGKWKKIE